MGNREIVAAGKSVVFTKTKSAGLFCECFEFEAIAEEVANMDILFRGIATGPAVSVGLGEDGLEMFATPFKIDETLKGRMPKKVKLVHPKDSQACGTDFSTSETILWCAYKGKLTDEDKIDTTYYTDGCARPQFTLAEYREVLG